MASRRWNWCSVKFEVPLLEDLVFVTVEVLPRTMDSGKFLSMHHAKVFKCRVLLFYSDVLASPSSVDDGLVGVILSKQASMDSWIKLLNEIGDLSVKSRSPVTFLTFQTCLQYTIVAKLAPQWNAVGKYLVQGRNFIEMLHRKANAVEVEVVCKCNESYIAVNPVSLRCPNEGVSFFGLDAISEVRLRNDPNCRFELSVPRWVYILPRLTRGRVTCIKRTLGDDSNFLTRQDLSRYWKNMVVNLYGYRLPDHEGIYYDVQFGFNKNSSSFTYPYSCIRTADVQRLGTCDAAAILHGFCTDLTHSVKTICGKVLLVTCTALPKVMFVPAISPGKPSSQFVKPFNNRNNVIVPATPAQSLANSSVCVSIPGQSDVATVSQNVKTSHVPLHAIQENNCSQASVCITTSSTSTAPLARRPLNVTTTSSITAKPSAAYTPCNRIFPQEQKLTLQSSIAVSGDFGLGSQFQVLSPKELNAKDSEKNAVPEPVKQAPRFYPIFEGKNLKTNNTGPPPSSAAKPPSTSRPFFPPRATATGLDISYTNTEFNCESSMKLSCPTFIPSFSASRKVQPVFGGANNTLIQNLCTPKITTPTDPILPEAPRIVTSFPLFSSKTPRKPVAKTKTATQNITTSLQGAASVKRKLVLTPTTTTAENLELSQRSSQQISEKKAKVVNVLSGDSVATLLDQGMISKINVNSLTSWLKENGVHCNSKMKKADLVEKALALRKA